jgi:hypothetical protein
MAAHEGLVHAVVRKQVLGDLPFAEALQAGRIGLWRAIAGYDPQQGTAFSTYAWTSIMHHVWREVKLAERVHSRAMAHLALGKVCSSAPRIADPAQVLEVTATRRSRPRRRSGCAGEEGDMVAKLSAVQARAQDKRFVQHCSLSGLQARLPLCWPTPSDVPPSPKRAYRSHYVYLGWQDLQDLPEWAELSDFDLVLRLIDFSGLRPVLALRLGWTSARGWTPFDPVSLFLLHGWQITNGWTRAETLRNLVKKRYADYAERFG